MGLVYFGEHCFDTSLIAFDKDGTLFDFNASWRPRFLEAAERLLYRFSNRTEMQDALFRTLGYNASDGTFGEDGPFATATSEATAYAAATVLHQYSRPTLPWHQCEQLVRLEFAPLLADSIELLPVRELAPLFFSLHEQDIRVAVITSDDRAPTEATLAKFGVSRFVDYIGCGDSPGHHKPAPDQLLEATNLLDVSPAQSVVVGDSATDLQMARAAGAGLAVGVLTGVGSRETLCPMADVVLDSIAEIRVGVSPPDERLREPDRSSNRPSEL
ncbi:MAG: HAD family hydrolase [Caldilineaceae bacterium]|nr:HAD family hydrolase [Caldilineaceae bacterium]